MILIIDNYDSFTFNLFQYVSEMYSEVVVLRNDVFSLKEIERLSPVSIIISPGPKRPEDAGLTVEVVRNFAGRIPILGVCLGHQAIGYAFGAKIKKAKRIVHGKVSPIFHDGKTIFSGIDNPFYATRCHSLAVDEESVNESILEVSARSEDGEIMALRHRDFLVEGVQFHPESILTKEGKTILRNFLKLSGVI